MLAFELAYFNHVSHIVTIIMQFIFKNIIQPWLVWLGGLSADL